MTVWLLDVDGVLNARRPGWGGPPRRAYAMSEGVSWPIRWAPALIARIHALHRTGTVEIRWCSTWCADVDELERLFGLPRLERAFTDPVEPGESADALKLTAAFAVIDAGYPLVWTDDAAIPDEGPERDRLLAGGRTLLIAPEPGRGLQPEHIDAIEDFLEAIDQAYRSNGRTADGRAAGFDMS
jgi:hypothetical protein